jgi:DNA-binding response OmpR family regulator
MATIFGANKVFEKPFDVDALRAAIASILGPPGAAVPA